MYFFESLLFYLLSFSNFAMIVRNSSCRKCNFHLKPQARCHILLFFLQLRTMEGELEEERKQRSSSIADKKTLDMDYIDLENHIDAADKGNKDAVKQLKRVQVLYWVWTV